MGFDVFETIIGPVYIREDGGSIKEVGFGRGCEDETAPSPLTDEAKRQLLEYFSGKRRAFDLPLDPEGTEFQRAVWQALCRIPYGETRSYADIARDAGRAKAFRAVGQANHNNPIAIIIPCHRVIQSGGSLGGYAGGIEIKKRLLTLEKQYR